MFIEPITTQDDIVFFQVQDSKGVVEGMFFFNDFQPSESPIRCKNEKGSELESEARVVT